MLTAGQVAVKLNLDKSEYEQGIASAKNSVNLLGAAFGSIASIGLGAMLMKVGQDALKASSNFEQASISFGVMLGNADKATKLVNDLQNMANVTPFETQDLLDGAKVLMNFGISAKEVLPDLQMLGDISGGNAEKMRSLTLAFSQMSSAGRLMGQDLLQMINAGFNPLQTISEKTGKSMAVLKDEMSEGKISVEQVKQAFTDATSEGGRFYKMMDKQSQSFEGLTSTMQDAYTLMTRSISDMALPAIKEQVIEVTKLLDATNEAIGTFKDWAAVNHQSINAISNVGLAIATTAVTFTGLHSVVTKLSGVYSSAVTAIKAVETAQAAATIAATTAAGAEQALYAARLKGDAEMIKNCITLQAKTAAEAASTAATAAATKATAAQYLITGNLTKAITIATTATKAFTVALLANPWTWVAVGIAGVVGAFVALKNNAESTKKAIDDLNATQDQNVTKTSEAIKTINELSGVKKLDYEQTKRLDAALAYLTEKYPNYIGKLKQELALKGKISKATAVQIANEMMLAKVKGLQKQRIALNKDIMRDMTLSSGLAKILPGAGWATKAGGRYGITRSNQKRDDALNAEKSRIEKERQAIINELTKLNEAEEEFSAGSSSSDGGKKKKGKTAKQIAAEENAKRKEALEYKLALLEQEKYSTIKQEEEIYKIELKQAQLKIDAAKKGTSEYAQALAAKMQLEVEHEKRLKALKSQQLVDDLEEDKRAIDGKIANLELDYEAHKVTKKQMLETEISFIQQKKTLETAALKEQLKLVEGNTAEEVKIKRASNRVIEELNREETSKSIELQNHKMLAYKSFQSDVASGWGSTVSSLIKGEMTVADAMDAVTNTLIDSFGNACGKIVEQWITDHLTMENATRLFAMAKVAWDHLIMGSNAAVSASNIGRSATDATVAGTSTVLTAANTALATSNTAVAVSSAAAATTTAASAGVMTGAAAGMGASMTAIIAPITALAGAFMTLAGASAICAITMPVIALSTTIIALSSMLAALGLGLLNTVMGLTAVTSMLFAPISVLLAAEFAIIGAAASIAAKAVASLAIALAAASAAAIPLVGWVLAPAAAAMTGAAIMAADAMVQFREKGGPVKRGQPYVVGEKRPELFVPDRDGTILPNTNSLSSGSEPQNVTTYNVSLNVSAIDTKDFKARVGDLTDFIHNSLQSGIKKRQLSPLGAR